MSERNSMASRSKASEDLGEHGPFDTPEQEVVLSVLRTNDLYQHRFGQFFRSHGLTEPQFNAMWLLARAGGPLPILEVGRRLIKVVPGVSRLIDGLEKSGFVLRERSETDRRIWYVRLTEAGQELVEEMSEPNIAMHRTLAGHLSEKECKQLIALLAKARASVESEASTNNEEEK